MTGHLDVDAQGYFSKVYQGIPGKLPSFSFRGFYSEKCGDSNPARLLLVVPKRTDSVTGTFHSLYMRRVSVVRRNLDGMEVPSAKSDPRSGRVNEKRFWIGTE